MRLIILVVVALGVFIGGCEQKSEPVTQKASQAEPENKASVVDQTKTVVNEAVQQVSDAVAAGGEKLHQAGVAAEQAVHEVADSAAKDLAAGAVVAQEKVSEVVEAVQQQATAVQKDGGSLINSVVDSAVKATMAPDNVSDTDTQTETVTAGTDLLSSVVAVATDVVSITQAPADTLVINNTQGNVTLKHAVHGEKYGCAVCHGEGTPAAFELGKERAHKLCKDCHKQNNGPVTCSGCHVK